MLKELYIENLAVIEKVNINFNNGLTVFTGETGAGKSILIDAINLVLGQRSNKDIIRTGKSKAYVCGVFSDISKEIKTKLAEYGYEIDNEDLIISREITSESKSVAKIMNKPITLSALKEIGTILINIHGQHDTQALLNKELHIDILDTYISNENALQKYKNAYDKYNSLKAQYKKITSEEEKNKANMDFLEHQVEEIVGSDLKIDEDIAIEAKLLSMRNHVKISENITNSYYELVGIDDELGGVDLINKVILNMDTISPLDAKIQAFKEKLEEIKYELDEVVLDISDYIDNFNFNPIEYEELEQRYDFINKMKRKYNKDIAGLIELGETSKKELEQISISDKLKIEIANNLKKQKQIVIDMAHKISESRKKYAKVFASNIEKDLIFLDMPNVKLRVEITKGKYGAKGCDIVEFLFSTNQGEELKSISKIASGGELSRIMLAIKSTMAKKDNVPTLIFDEIDTGVSGKSAQKIGLKLKEVSKNRQVLCVTHSAQIAALADNNLLIQKQTKDNRTYTNVSVLNREEKINEVARIMSTDKITDLMIQNATEMIDASKNS